MSLRLMGYEVSTLLLRGETVLGPEETWEGDDHLGLALTVKVGDVQHEIQAEMIVDNTGCGDTSYACETLEVTEGSVLHEWLGEQVDAVWAATTAKIRGGVRLLRSLANMRQILGDLDANQLLKVADQVIAKSKGTAKSKKSLARKPKGART